MWAVEAARPSKIGVISFEASDGILETYLVISQNSVPRTSRHAVLHVAGRASMPLAEQEAHSTHLSDAGWSVGRSVGGCVCVD